MFVYNVVESTNYRDTEKTVQGGWRQYYYYSTVR